MFDCCLHKYVITDAIRDENVLKFSIEYVGKYRNKVESENEVDIEVEAIDTKELLEAPDRLNKITDYIINNHERKTHSGEFTAMFCVSNIDVLIAYYELFKKKKQEGKHNLKIATIFSYQANEEDKDADGYIEDAFAQIDDKDKKENKHTRDKLDEFIADYNDMFQSKYSTKDSKSFYNYYKDIANRVKKKQVDILLVVNMFLTGFDSKPLNALYVDKNLRYHGLIQAFSRTNRILNELKSQGNILSFRNLKKKTDEAIILFSNKDAIEEIIIPPYEEQVDTFDNAFAELLKIAPTYQSVDELKDENEELAFVQQFREVMRSLNVLQSFADFSWDDLGMDAQQFENYKSKYLDLYDKVKTDNQKEVVSVLNEVDFELELIHRDEINVTYILGLLADLHNTAPKDKAKKQQQIVEMLTGQAQLRSKKELIEKFINDNLPKIEDSTNIPDEFDDYWNAEKRSAFDAMCKDEGLNPAKLDKIINKYMYSGKEPLRDTIIGSLESKPSVLKRKSIGERVIQKIMSFVDTYITDVPSGSAKIYELPSAALGMAADDVEDYN